MARPGSRSLPPERSGRPPRVVDLVREHDLDAYVVPWRALADHVRDSSYFQTPDWLVSWWATVGQRAPTRVAFWSDGGEELTAVAALARSRERLHRRVPLSVPVYANAGSGPGDADHCGPLAVPALQAEVSRWLASACGTRSLLLRHVSPGSLPVAGARIVETTSCPRLDLTDDGRIGRSPNFRRQLQRYSKRLRESGTTFDWLPAGEVDLSIFATLMRLHHQRRATAGRATSLTARHRELFVRLGGLARPGRGPAALVARRGTEVVGVCYGFEWNGTFSAYQSGWDPAQADQSLGTVLVYEAILGARKAGLHTFDLLRGAEEYKFRFGARDQLDVSYLLARGVSGLALDLRSRARDRAHARSGRGVAPD